MRRLGRCAVLVAASFAATAPALAQFGGIFGPPPRPPGNIPNQQYDQQRTYEPTPPSQPQYQPQYQPPAQYPPAQTDAAPYVGPPQNGSIRSEPLPPPPGVPDQRAAVPPVAPQPGVAPPPQPGVPPGPGVNPAPGQAQPNGQPNSQPNSPAGAVDTTLQPGDEIVIEPPAKKTVNPTAIFSGLDKITGRITSFDVAINETVAFGALQVTPRVCYTRPPTETPQTDAFVEVDEVTLQGEIKRIFTGWMFAASPGLHAVEHPIYDVWLTDCKGGSPPTPVADAAPPPPAAAPKPPPRPRKPAPTPPRAQAPRQ